VRLDAVVVERVQYDNVSELRADEDGCVSLLKLIVSWSSSSSVSVMYSSSSSFPYLCTLYCIFHSRDGA